MEIEVIVQNEQDARIAEKAGADRLELVATMEEGGLTPNLRVIEQVLASVNVPVFVMVRPHSRHFCYRGADLEVIKETLSVVTNCQADGIVFGCLNEKKEVDVPVLETVLSLKGDLKMTFHRAFDEVMDQTAAYQTLCRYSSRIERILTSGGAEKAGDALDQLEHLIALSKEARGPAIMVGSGLHPQTFTAIHKRLKAEAYHFGSGVRIHQSFNKTIDPSPIEWLKEIETD
ncbi:copper homeostasis protein CutC [Pullulanibacillus sp. KACC 23026]|uniref:copper homeostasis protein CutC n=1 Tax=Pullulanibacillus sp. KACC 23026 TaxID=3028315 RepID=UPI0023B17EF1|nr:copper homeostasis protein CutC [Pullulanibacillus sp. KACC 23026]WEG13198.1 copper homeostasis protein CutC [Pullulanibacillus sp. KACC 23026]